MPLREFAEIESIERLLPSAPEQAIRQLAEFLRRDGPARRPLARARGYRLGAQAQQLVGRFPEAGIAELKEAIEIFDANAYHAELCESRGLMARLMYAHGRYGEAISAGMLGFRDHRAPPLLRLQAARGALWPLMSQRLDARARWFNIQVRELCELCGDNDTTLGVRGLLAIGDFVCCLADAGVPSAVFPYPRSPAQIDLDECRRRVAVVRDDLARRWGGGPEPAGFDAMVPIAIASLTAFVDGTAAAQPIFDRIRQAGARPGALVLAVEGMAHVFNGEMEAAIPLLNRAIAVATASGRPFVAAGFHFPLFTAYLKLGRHEQALESLSRYHASRGSLGTDTGLHEASADTADTRDGAGVAGRPPVDVRHLQSQPPYLRKAIKFIQANYAQPLSVVQIVAASGASRRSLELAFRDYRNVTPLEALRRFRLEVALKMLREDGVRVAQVREAVGYTSTAAFSRDFRRAFGASPGKLAPHLGPASADEAD